MLHLRGIGELCGATTLAACRWRDPGDALAGNTRATEPFGGRDR